MSFDVSATMHLQFQLSVSTLYQSKDCLTTKKTASSVFSLNLVINLDVIAVVKEVGELASITAKASQRQVRLLL